MRKKPFRCTLQMSLTCLLALLSFQADPLGADEPKKRDFLFHYNASVGDLPKGAKVRVWIPIAQSTEHQKLKITDINFPGMVDVTQEKKFGNKMVYFEHVQNGDYALDFKMRYEVTRFEVTAKSKVTVAEREQLKKFLQPNRLVPTDGKPVETFESFLKSESISLPSDPLAEGRVFYDFVQQHMKYDKSKPGYGTGNSTWACDSRTGNCTDFHSLFISVARANKVPAQFRIGFPLPEKRGAGEIGGYHCWALFHVDKKGWIPVDISEADKDPKKNDYFFGNLNENRIQFTTGRDIVLEPAQDGKPLNYFIYPYVEVDGKPWPKDKVKLTVNFTDRG